MSKITRTGLSASRARGRDSSEQEPGLQALVHCFSEDDISYLGAGGYERRMRGRNRVTDQPAQLPCERAPG